MDGYLGQIYFFAGNFTPKNFSVCNGVYLPIAQYQALYSILSTTYGGDGHTNFALPDARSRLIIGQGSSAADPMEFQPGYKGGSETMSIDHSQMPKHTHRATMMASPAAGSTNSTIPSANGYLGATALGGPSSAALFEPSPSPDDFVDLNENNFSAGYTGGNAPFPILPPYTGIPLIICTAGLYPSRN